MASLAAALVGPPGVSAQVYEYGLSGLLLDHGSDEAGIDGAWFEARWLVDASSPIEQSMSPESATAVYAATAELVLLGTQGGANDGTFSAENAAVATQSRIDPSFDDFLALLAGFELPTQGSDLFELNGGYAFLGNDYFSGSPPVPLPFEYGDVTMIAFAATMRGGPFDDLYSADPLPEPVGWVSAIVSLAVLGSLRRRARC